MQWLPRALKLVTNLSCYITNAGAQRLNITGD
jgi:hypothetical protein